MDVIHVYRQSDLDTVNESGIIPYNIYIHGEHISLENIRLIKGYLGFSGASSIDLCDIEEICGDLWVSSFHFIPENVTLSKLKKVGGSVNLNYTPLKDLGILEYVGADLFVRDTNITDLGVLTFVGGTLLLPYDLKNTINLDNIEIGAEVKYFRQSKNKKKFKCEFGLSPSDRPIPLINPKTDSYIVPQYISSLSEATPEQKSFYLYFKESFYNGVIIDVQEFYEYPRFLIVDMLNDDFTDIHAWLKDYDRLIKAYPQTDGDGAYLLRRSKERFDLGWELEKRKTILNFSSIGYYEERLSKELFDVDILLKMSGTTCLTKWGYQHLDDIKPFIKQQFDKFQQKWNSRFLNVFVDPKFNKKRNYDFYKQFYISEESFNFYNNIEYGKFLPEDYEKSLPNIAENAIKSQCRKFTMDAEDAYRESIGMPKIGEYWRSETELYYSIKEAFENIEVKQHHSPRWLGLQHLDIYIPQYNIGIEYQGIQHYKPVDYFGGEEAFLKGQERDARKRRLCEENDCILIYVDEGYDLNAVVREIDESITKRERRYV